MPGPKRTLTNEYRDCQFIKLDATLPRSPIVVAQEGCAPDDVLARTRLFYLQHDGKWINEIARSTRPDIEGGDIIFEGAGDAMKLLSSLFGKPAVRDIPISDADVEAYITKAKNVSSPEAAYRDFLARYREAQAKAKGKSKGK
jgi:hypothetical protein